jgi:hypothetical protein
MAGYQVIATNVRALAVLSGCQPSLERGCFLSHDLKARAGRAEGWGMDTPAFAHLAPPRIAQFQVVPVAGSSTLTNVHLFVLDDRGRMWMKAMHAGEWKPIDRLPAPPPRRESAGPKPGDPFGPGSAHYHVPETYSNSGPSM